VTADIAVIGKTMEPLQKLDWIPLYLHRLKASRTWAMPDFQWCWFMKLIIELADSETPGYLPNDVDVLWRLAGARTRDFFLKRDGAGLVDREFRRTADGLRIYNARLLEVLKEQNEKLHRKKQPAKEKTLSLSGLGFSSIKNEDLKAPVCRLFSYYQEILERDARYKLTERRAEQCERRLIECLQAVGGDLAKAEASAKDAIYNLACSRFHVQNGHTDWIDHIFGSAEVFQKRLSMGPGVPAEKPASAKPEYSYADPLPELAPENGAWAALLERLALQTTRLAFDTWLRPPRPLGVNDSVLYVRVPTPEFKHIHEKFGREIAEAVRALGLPLREVRFVVGR